MMCAAVAGQRGRRVLLIEHYHKIGEKIRISGGGRCNFTNLHCKPENFLSRNAHFCRSALARYTPRDFLALVERHGIHYHEKKLGQLFCDDSAQQIIDMLKRECERGGVQWCMPCEVLGVERVGSDFVVHCAQGELRAQSLVIATGGLTVPKIGTSAFGYRIAEQFGLPIVAPRPALVPLAWDSAMLEQFGELSGVSADVEVSCNGGRFRENLLFTHRGLSGPAILQISSYWRESDEITINLLPGNEDADENERDVQAWLLEQQSGRKHLHNLLAEVLPGRLAQRWCDLREIAKPLNELSKQKLREAAQALQHWRVRPSGTLGYNKAEVTLGGVDTGALSSQTMQAKAVPGLYFVGEVVDVTGHLGGFNFQWAWASAHAAGLAA
jgi:predicted Rossmann fold flavoprotein